MMPRDAGSAGRPRRRRAGRDGRRHRLAGRASAGSRWLDSTRSSPPHTLGSTHGHSRIIREAYFEHPQYVPLVQRAYALWAELEASAGTRLFQACGGLMVGRPGRRRRRRHAPRGRRARGCRCRPGRAEDVRHARAGAGAGRRHGRRLRAARRRAGAGTRGGRDARPGTSRRRAPASCPSPCATGRAEAGHVDVRSTEPARPRAAPGARRRSVAADAARRPRAAAHRRARRAVLVSTTAATAVRAAAFPSFCSRRRTAACCTGCPIRDTASSSPSIMAAGRRRRTTVEPGRCRRTSVTPSMRLRADGSATCPPAPPTRPSASTPTRPTATSCSTGIPAAPGVFVCSACSGHGFKFAPAIGEAVASIVATGTSPHDLAPFRLARLA